MKFFKAPKIRELNLKSMHLTKPGVRIRQLKIDRELAAVTLMNDENHSFLVVFDLQSMTQVNQVEDINSAIFSRDGSHLIIASDGHEN